MSKTKTMIVFWSLTMNPKSLRLTLGGNDLEESVVLDILGVTFDAKLTFERHLRSLSRVVPGMARYLEEVMESIS